MTTLNDEAIIMLIETAVRSNALRPVAEKTYEKTGDLPKARYTYLNVFGEACVRLERDYSGDSVDGEYDENLRILADEDAIYEDIVNLNAIYKNERNLN